jgi:tetratricopeptide (TPR) repeat protein
MYFADQARRAWNQAEWTKAEKLYRKAMAACDGDVRCDTYYADLAGKLSGTLYYQNCYKEAEPFSRIALETQVRAVGRKNRLAVEYMRELAVLVAIIRGPAEAIPLEQEAVDFMRTAYGIKCSELYDTEEDLGGMFKESLQYKEAEAVYNDYMSNLRKAGGAQARYYPIQSRLGEIYRARGECLLANKVLRQALEEEWGSKNVWSGDISRTLMDQSYVHSDMGYARESALDCEESLRLETNAYGDKDPALFSPRLQVAISYARIGRSKEAESIWSEGVQVLIADERKHSVSSAADVHNLGLLSSELGHQREAENYFEQAIKLQKSEPNVDYRGIARSSQWLAKLYLKQGRFDKALALLNDSPEMKKVAVDGPSALAAITDELRGTLFEHHKNYSAALACYKRALVARVKFLGEDAPVTLKTKALIASLSVITNGEN